MSPGTGDPAGVEVVVRGAGAPVTVFAHGLGSGIPETRALASGIMGTRVFFSFPGHGGSAAPADGWGYPQAARLLAHVADRSGAQRAVGVSFGAGALCGVLAARPDRFDRVVFLLPAVLDRPRGPAAAGWLGQAARLAAGGDVAELASRVAEELPPAERATPTGRRYARRRAQTLASPPVARILASAAGSYPLADRSALAAVRAPALVVAQPDDPLHPLEVAEELAACLPRATLHRFDTAGAIWARRAELRHVLGRFLNDGP